MTASSYSVAGVRGQGEALSAVARHLGPTLPFAEGAEVLTAFGHYAAVLRLAPDLALALCTDGVGSKTVIASALNRYDTIGFDCVAMSVNDLLCVGARPLALVDYLGVHTLDAGRVDALLEGLGAAAKEAGIAIPGGELAQLPSVIGSTGDDSAAGADPTAFDLVGTAVGTLHPERVIVGRGLSPGDALIGIESSGIHSNGLTLARRTLLRGAGLRLEDRPEALARSLGEELLEPTLIYVRAILDLWDHGLPTPGLAHITGDGLANLCRLEAPVGYRIHTLPEPPALFGLIQAAGAIDDAQMFTVFNMGIGFVIVTPRGEAAAALESLKGSGYRALLIGEVTTEPGVVRVEPRGLHGGLRAGQGYFHSA